MLLGTLAEVHARFVGVVLASGFPDAARDYALKALAERPDDTVLRAMLERMGGAPAR